MTFPFPLNNENQHSPVKTNMVKTKFVISYSLPSANRPPLSTLLILIMLMASRLSFSRSLHPLLKHSPTKTKTPFCRLTPKHLNKSYLCPLWSPCFSFCLQSLHYRNHKSRITSPTFSFSAFSSLTPPMADVSVEANPLLQDFDFPPFDAVKAEHVRPGIRTLLEKSVEGNLEKIKKRRREIPEDSGGSV